MDDEKYFDLIIDETYMPSLTEAEAVKMKEVFKSFFTSYIKHKETMQFKDWFEITLKEYLPEHTTDEVTTISEQIISTLKTNEEKQASLSSAIRRGQSKEHWFASDIKKTTSYMSTSESASYLHELDNAMSHANESLTSVFITQNGTINQNRNLDGFIAEQYHAQTFNLNAEATGSSYRAKVLQPNGKGYAKNSVDVVIVDANGKTVKRYQAKYCKDSESTIRSFKNGDYRGQSKLVADGHEIDIKNAHRVIEAPDGTTSNPLAKQKAKQLQNEAQTGNWNDLNWNEYKAKDLTIGIGKQAGVAALQGAAIGVGFKVAENVWNGEKIDGEEIIVTAINSGTDFGIKAVTAGAIKVGVEKGFIKAIPKGTPAGTIANIAYVAIENVKIIGKIASGDLTIKEGFEKMEQTTVATLAGMAASTKGALIGASVGTVFGPVGTVLGGFVGGTVGYMAGSKMGELAVKGAQKVREVTTTIMKDVIKNGKTTLENMNNGFKNITGSIASFLGF